jgi:diacylglycerol O-acyltransferase / wax synthase
MSKAERVSSVDTTWLRMDRPANPMVIIGVLILEGPLDLNTLEETIAERFLAVPRLRQHVEIRGGEYWWVDDPYFDRTRHIKRLRLPGKGDQDELQRYIAELASERMDKARPLWQLRIVEDYQGGAAVITRFHHAIGDGMALVGMMLSVTDGGDLRVWTAPKSKKAERPWLPLSIPGLKTVESGVKTIRKGVGASLDLLKEATALVSEPGKTARAGAGVAGELAWLLLMPEDTWTRFKGKPSGNKRVAWTDPIPLPEVKAVSKALGCTINDMLLASVAGALHEYLKDKGDPTAGVEVRALVPVDMRSSHEIGDLGNKFGIVAVELPVGVDNPLDRLYEVRRRMQSVKRSMEPPVTLALFAVMGHAPHILQERLFNMLTKRATAVMTNVPGPKDPLYLAGAKIKQAMFWVPQSSDIGMGVSILSYNEMVQFGLITDAEMVPDPEAIIANFRPKFEELLYYALMSPWGDDGERAFEKAAPKKAPRQPVKSRRPSQEPAFNDAATEKVSREPARRSRPTSKPQALAETAPENAPRPARKSRRAAEPATDEAARETASLQAASKSRRATEPRKRGPRVKAETASKTAAPPKPNTSARRKLPRA